MSTRGCVAVGRSDGWKGVYNHYDSYPTGLGAELWKELQKANLSKFAESLLNFTDWREYLNGGKCKYCGGKGLGQPHSISTKITGIDKDLNGTPDPKIKRNLQLTGYPDPKAEHHEHTLDGEKSVEDTQITSENPDPLFIEWVYVVNPEDRTLEILTNRGKPGTDKPVDEPWLRDDGYWEYGHCAYRHARLALVDIDGPQPDWQLIEDIDRAVAVPGRTSGAEEVSERLKRGRETKECPACGVPLPESEDLPDLIGHENCIRKELKRLGAEVEVCINKPQEGD